MKKLYYGDKEVPEVEFHLKLFMSPPPHELVEIFSEIDIVAIYKTPYCKLPMVGTCLKKLKEDGMIRDESKTIVIYGDKAYKFDEALAQAQSEIKPVAASAPESGTKKKVPFYYPDFLFASDLKTSRIAWKPKELSFIKPKNNLKFSLNPMRSLQAGKINNLNSLTLNRDLLFLNKIWMSLISISLY